MYNTSLEVNYDDDDQYRALLSQVFYSESLEYTDTITSGMDYLWEKTQTCPLFIKLYVLGAAKLMSEDPSMGLAILMSYDYFADFHALLQLWFRDPGTVSESCMQYQKLCEILTKK
jgi:hypothetical protein